MVNPPRRFAPPPLTRGYALLLLLGLYLILGLTGHDPWKNEDAAHFGRVWNSTFDSEWLRFGPGAGSPPEPPLFYWVARLTSAAFGGLLGAPDATRLATLLFAAAACAFLYLAARELYGKEAAAAAPLALAGCLGFLVQSHETQPVLASVSGISALLAGAAALHSQRGFASVLIAFGVSAIALSDGLALLPFAVALLATLVVSAEPRIRAGIAIRVVIALSMAAILAAPWFLALAKGDAGGLAQFVSAERDRLFSVNDPVVNALGYLNQLAWFAWPAWPLALWGIWSRWHARKTPALWLGAISFLLIWMTASVSETVRAPILLLLLPPLSLLAAQGVPQLRRGAANALDWFGRLTFGLFAFVLWLGWFAMQFGVPPKIARNLLRLVPGFEPSTTITAFGFALLLTLLWLWFVVREPRSPLRSIGHWTAGMALVWALTMTLWQPWIEHMRSYRPIGAELSALIPGSGEARPPCIEGRAFSEAQRAAVEYAMNRRMNPENRVDCRYLLVLGGIDEYPPESEWRKIWEGSRPGDRKERLRLYHRG